MKISAPNLKLSIGDETDLWNKVMKKVKLKRNAGPFADIPYKDDYIQSPIGLVPRDNGKDMRLIFHLSYPRSGKLSSSINANTPKNLCTVKYPDLSEAIKLINSIIKESGSCAISKTDASSAFRNLGISLRF